MSSFNFKAISNGYLIVCREISGTRRRGWVVLENRSEKERRRPEAVGG